MANQELNLLNLGCGHRFHKDWINIDFVSHSPHVRSENLKKGIPLDTGSIDMVYHSHLLEHFEKAKAVSFLLECHRVLKVGGILRVVVPDLETICREYLKYLDQLKSGNKENQARYDWMIIELLDQMQRNEPGGEMLKYWNQKVIPDQEFIENRLGDEIRTSLKELKDLRNLTASRVRQEKHLSFKTRIKYFILEYLGFDRDHFEIGKFRSSGEVHYWMYDQYSLSNLLNQTGFHSVCIQKANSSYFGRFASFQLDVDEKGETRKPDSIFVEAIK
jgi:predicted SAM-dependent methyltransferase